MAARARPSTEVVNSLGLFNGCDLAFISDLASAGARSTMVCGDAVMEQVA